MRNERRIGGPVRESTGDRVDGGPVLIDRMVALPARDREPDDGRVGVVGIGGCPSCDCCGRIELIPPRPADAPLVEELDVHAAALVVAEAVLEGVPEGVQAEVPGAAGVGAVQERAVVASVGHRFTSAAGHRRPTYVSAPPLARRE